MIFAKEQNFRAWRHFDGGIMGAKENNEIVIWACNNNEMDDGLSILRKLQYV